MTVHLIEKLRAVTNAASVARMERSGMRDLSLCRTNPDYASLHAGYACWRGNVVAHRIPGARACPRGGSSHQSMRQSALEPYSVEILYH